MLTSKAAAAQKEIEELSDKAGVKNSRPGRVSFSVAAAATPRSACRPVGSRDAKHTSIRVILCAQVGVLVIAFRVVTPVDKTHNTTTRDSVLPLLFVEPTIHPVKLVTTSTSLLFVGEFKVNNTFTQRFQAV